MEPEGSWTIIHLTIFWASWIQSTPLHSTTLIHKDGCTQFRDEDLPHFTVRYSTKLGTKFGVCYQDTCDSFQQQSGQTRFVCRGYFMTLLVARLTASNGRMTNEVGRIWKKRATDKSSNLPNLCLEGLRQITETFGITHVPDEIRTQHLPIRVQKVTAMPTCSAILYWIQMALYLLSFTRRYFSHFQNVVWLLSGLEDRN